MDLTTSSLVSDLKLAGSFPDGMFAESDYISFLNTGYYSELLPFILRHREEYFVTFEDFSYSDSISIPEDAMGQKLREVVTVTSDGNYIDNIPRMTLEEISRHGWDYYQRAGFYLEDNKIKFHPVGTINEDIRLYYFKRPNKLTLESNCMKLTSVDGADASGTVPSSWTTDTEISVVSKSQPYNINDSYSISAVDSDAGTITLSSSGFSEGDFICPKGLTAIPKIPLELRDCLIQAGIVNAMISLKDVNGVKLARDELSIALDNASGLIAQRVEGEPKKIVNTGGVWSIRNNRRGYRGRF